jgi:pimeloyl-ACP methyl ester carboxylesterase
VARWPERSKATPPGSSDIVQAPVEHTIDVTSAAGLGMDAYTAVTVFLPDQGMLRDPPIVCFAFPGGGYSRRYYSFDMPDGAGGGQARFHCDHGWIFIACDHLGFGDSTIPSGNALTLDNVAAANNEMVKRVMQRLEEGTLVEGLRPITGATALGIGQSMGGCFTIVAQGQFGTFDGVGILGFSAIHTIVPTRPGTLPIAWPWISRASPLDNPKNLNQAAMSAALEFVPSNTPSAGGPEGDQEHPYQWSFHYDDEPADIVALDMMAAFGKTPNLPPWRSATTPPCGRHMVAPGVVALEAAAITVPVLIALGERDVVPDPAAEPKAFKSATDISLFICRRMGHMHNFAHTRRLFWSRIQFWGYAVAQLRTIPSQASRDNQTKAAT